MNPSNPFGNLEGFFSNPFPSKMRLRFGLVLFSGYVCRVFNFAFNNWQFDMSSPHDHWICTWSTGNTFPKKADELFFQELLLVVMVHFCQMWEWFWLFLGHWTALQQVKSAITCYSFFACFWKTIINGKCLQ